MYRKSSQKGPRGGAALQASGSYLKNALLRPGALGKAVQLCTARRVAWFLRSSAPSLATYAALKHCQPSAGRPPGGRPPRLVAFSTGPGRRRSAGKVGV